MAEAKKIKCEVIHPKLNLRVDSKMQRVPVGTVLILTEAQMESFGPLKVREAGKKQVIDVSDEKKSDDKKSETSKEK